LRTAESKSSQPLFVSQARPFFRLEELPGPALSVSR